MTSLPSIPCRRVCELIGRVFIGVICIVLVPLASAADGDSLEYSVKAAYLYKFGIYIEWPATAFASPSSPLNLCVVGEDPFGAVLDDAIKGQRIHGRPVVVRRLKTAEANSGCHIAYLGFADSQRISQHMEALRGSAVLTVGDTRRAGGGIVTFVINDNRVRFNIDEEAAVQSGISISSKLLNLALDVKHRQAR